MLGDRALPLAGVRHFEIRSLHGAYRVRFMRSARNAAARTVHTQPQSSNPRPGPSLVVRIAGGGQFNSAELTARLTPGRA